MNKISTLLTGAAMITAMSGSAAAFDVLDGAPAAREVVPVYQVNVMQVAFAGALGEMLAIAQGFQAVSVLPGLDVIRDIINKAAPGEPYSLLSDASMTAQAGELTKWGVGTSFRGYDQDEVRTGSDGKLLLDNTGGFELDLDWPYLDWFEDVHGQMVPAIGDVGQSSDGRLSDLKPGEVALMKAGTMHEQVADGDDQAVTTFIVVSPGAPKGF